VSFILDALRKSEHERQRQTGPALVEVAVAAPKSRTNRWATAAIALLLVNLVAIGVLLLVKSRDEPNAAPAAQAPVAATAPAPAGSAPASVAAQGTQASVTQALPEPQGAMPPPMLRPAAEARPAAGTRGALEQEMSAYSPAMDYEAAAAAATPPPGPAAVTPVRRGGSVVYQSMPEAGPAATYQPAPGGYTGNLPQADDMTARGALPELRLELHVWSTQPQERFVFVNGRRYREGDTTAEGAKVEEITREGVVMNNSGSRFLLSRD
jgi:general secretion pathway protein B